MSDACLKDWLMEAANGEAIEAVVLGEMGWGDYGSAAVPNYALQPKGQVLTWEQALPWISYEFNDGYGSPGCNAVNAWTKSRVIWVTQYDGSTSTSWAYRNPTALMPEMPGG